MFLDTKLLFRTRRLWTTGCVATRIILGFTLLTSTAVGQVTIQVDPVAGPGSNAHQHVVRASDGTLYTLNILETVVGERELRLYISDDAGVTWSLDPLVLNDSTSGLAAPNPTNYCALAIDSDDRLHLCWASYYYPSDFSQYYRQFATATSTTSAIVDVSAITGATAPNRTAAMNVIVDADDHVWLVAHGPSNWVERLLQSTLPFASDLTFSDLGAISPSASAQNTRLAVDSQGRIHCSFYRNVGAGNYEHRIYEDGTGWGPSVVLGNTDPTNDYYGTLAADELGNVHALYVVDAATGSDWSFEYRRWDEANGWDSPVALFEATPAEYTGIANYRIFALACDATTGDAYAFYRDIGTDGSLVVAEKSLGDSIFSIAEQVESPSLAEHAYYLPTIRGTLYPSSNRTNVLDLTWQYRETGSPPFELRFTRLVVGGGGFRRGDANNDTTFDISDPVLALAALFIIGTAPPSCLDAADSNDDGTFDISDPVYSLASLFIPGSPPPPSPGPDVCGTDPPPSLGCLEYGCP